MELQVFKFFIINIDTNIGNHLVLGNSEGEICYGKFKVPSDLNSGVEGLMEVLASDNEYDFYMRDDDYGVKINPEHLKDVLIECSFADIFCYLGNDVCDYIDELKDPPKGKYISSRKLFIKAGDRYAEKMQLKDGAEPHIM